MESQGAALAVLSVYSPAIIAQATGRVVLFWADPATLGHGGVRVCPGTMKTMKIDKILHYGTIVV